jgi:glycosyltransferase involved in cell wall biosynthesis
MKLLLITSSFPQNDLISGVFIPDTIRALNGLGVSVHVLTQNCYGSEALTNELWTGCAVTYFGWSGGSTPLVSMMKQRSGMLHALQYLIKSVLAGKRICRNWKPDVIFAEWLIPAGFIARILSALTKIPYCCRALGSDVYIASNNILWGPLIKNVARNSSFLFADGFDLCVKTSNIARGKKCYFAATARKLKNKRSNFLPGTDTGLFTFCSVGRLHHVKGFAVLIKACSILGEKGINFRCYIVGSGEEKEKLEDLIEKSALGQKVILTGRLEDGDISALLQHVDCVVIPSISESIPLILSEAVNVQKPLVVTDVGDMGFLAEKYKLGYVVEAGNHQNLAGALIEMSDMKLRSFFYNRERYDELSAILSVDAGAKVIFDKIAGLVKNMKSVQNQTAS